MGIRRKRKAAECGEEKADDGNNGESAAKVTKTTTEQSESDEDEDEEEEAGSDADAEKDAEGEGLRVRMHLMSEKMIHRLRDIVN